MTMFWQQEPLATLFWGCLFVFLVTWAWAGERYHQRGKARADQEWRDALKWADQVHQLPRPPHRTEEQWETMKFQADQIVRGHTNDHWSSAKTY